MNLKAFENLVRKEYGLTYGSVGWTYQGKGNDAMASQLNEASLCLELIKYSFTVRGVCVVAANPTMIVVRRDEGPFCMISSLDNDGTGKLGSLLFKEYKMNEVPPEYNGCMLFQEDNGGLL